MSVKKLNLKKFGFVRAKDEDFSDDGTRFIVYTYNGWRVTYATFDDEHFISATKPGAKCCDDYNGVVGLTDEDIETLKVKLSA